MIRLHDLSRRLRLAVKWTLAHLLYISGVLHLWKHLTLRNRVVVLTYHRVLSDTDCARTWSHPAIVVRRRTFERHIEILRREFDVLSLGELESYLAGSRLLTRPSCLVTFDDGWRDTYTEAWPILRSHSVPAVVFISVGFIGTRDVLWQERLRALLFRTYHAARADAAFACHARSLLAPHGYAQVLDAAEDTVRREIINAVLARKYEDANQALAPIRDLEAMLAERPPSEQGPDQFMSWNMVRTMANEGAAFGGHGVTHRLLTTLSEADVMEEVAGARDQIRRCLGTEPRSFAYPDGKWSPVVAECLDRTGYVLAFSTEGGLVSRGDTSNAIRRMNIHEAGASTKAMFLAHLVGLL